MFACRTGSRRTGADSIGPMMALPVVVIQVADVVAPPGTVTLPRSWPGSCTTSSGMRIPRPAMAAWTGCLAPGTRQSARRYSVRRWVHPGLGRRPGR